MKKTFGLFSIHLFVIAAFAAHLTQWEHRPQEIAFALGALNLWLAFIYSCLSWQDFTAKRDKQATYIALNRQTCRFMALLAGGLGFESITFSLLWSMFGLSWQQIVWVLYCITLIVLKKWLPKMKPVALMALAE